MRRRAKLPIFYGKKSSLLCIDVFKLFLPCDLVFKTFCCIYCIYCKYLRCYRGYLCTFVLLHTVCSCLAHLRQKSDISTTVVHLGG